MLGPFKSREWKNKGIEKTQVFNTNTGVKQMITKYRKNTNNCLIESHEHHGNRMRELES